MRTWILFLSAVYIVGTPASAQSVERVTNVIEGKLARSGSSHRKAFDDKALAGLCEQGYTQAIYVYPGAKPHTVSCSSGRSIKYLSMTNWEKPTSILDAVDSAKKTMVHCWYGVHASNFVSALALRRFCGFSPDQAASYFVKGVPPKSLPPARIAKLADEIRAANVIKEPIQQGCPSPK